MKNPAFVTTAQHKAFHKRLHLSLEQLVNDFLQWNPTRFLRQTSVSELYHWSARQMEAPDEGEPPDLNQLKKGDRRNVLLVAKAIANARAGRRGAPPIANVLEIVPADIRTELIDDAEAVMSALEGTVALQVLAQAYPDHLKSRKELLAEKKPLRRIRCQIRRTRAPITRWSGASSSFRRWSITSNVFQEQSPRTKQPRRCTQPAFTIWRVGY